MDNRRQATWLAFAVAMLLVLSPRIVFAHTGIGDVNGFTSGLAHPIGGIDHLAAMIGVGIWAAQRGGRAIWLVPLAFMVVMSLGGLLAMLAVSIPLVEPGIAASVLILGILIGAAVRLPLVASALLVGAFALFHGHAHGAEMPHTASGLMYGIGFLTGTALLHACGVGIGLIARQPRSIWLARFAGSAMVVCGIYLLLPN